MNSLFVMQVLDQSQSKRFYITDIAEEEDGNEVTTSAELPPLSEFLLSAADILSLKLSAKLVVVCIFEYFIFCLDTNDSFQYYRLAHVIQEISMVGPHQMDL